MNVYSHISTCSQVHNQARRCDALQRHPRTVDRWKKAKIIPPADRTVNGREYWNEGGLDDHDRQLVGELAATAK
jgi:hypothetical protein